jgi:hypothetical protein
MRRLADRYLDAYASVVASVGEARAYHADRPQGVG